MLTAALTVRARVAVAAATMLLPLLGLGGAAVWFLQSTVEAFGESVDEAIGETLPLADAGALVLALETTVRPALMDPAAGGDAYRDARDALREALVRLDSRDLTEEGALVASAHASVDRGTARIDAALAGSPGTDAASAVERAAVLREDLRTARGLLQEAEERSTADLLDELGAAEESHGQGLMAVLAALLVGVLVALTAGTVLVRATLAPLAQLQEGARRLGDGTLSHRLAATRRDEFGDLAAAFNAMAEGLERSQEQLAHSSMHDALTGLPNRVLFADRTAQALARQRRQGRHVAVLLIDLDGFKAVNDTLGHDAGDRVLQAAADRLRLSVRPEDTAARLGGDEFAVLVESDTAEQAQGVAERILHAMRPAFSHAGQELFLSASIGLAGTATTEDVAGDDLLRAADLAMYSAKQGGRDAVCRYDPAMHDDAQERLRLDSDLRRALERGELAVHYQPIYGIDGHPLVAVEALLRWTHPELGPVPPDRFIPVAESSGLMTTLGAWVLDEACRQLREWDGSGGESAAGRLQVSVNLSPRQLADDGLPGLVRAALERHAVAPHRLILEITESMMVTDVPLTVARLRDLKALGVQLAVDDFGTGYSSLSYLQQFPIDRIKIDKSFVDRLGTLEGRALAEGIINLARSLTLEPIAEGIEQESQRDALDQLGCRLGQGYHFARPEPPDQITRRLAAAAPSAAVSGARV